MGEPFRLQVLLELAELKLEAATTELQGLRARQHDAQDELERLRKSRSAYRQALAQALAGSLEVDRLRDFQAFLSKLSRAIAEQSEEVDRCGLVCAQAQQRWLALRNREQALRVLRARHRKGQVQDEARLEQKQQDEYALRWVRPPDY